MNTTNPIKDPVCGMTVQPEKAAGTQEYQGTTYHFCSTHCLEKFRADPQKYATPKTTGQAPAAAHYTCPMHPDVISDQPGKCPKCGMTLKPQ